MDDKEALNKTIECMRDVRLFGAFDSAVRLGITFDSASVPFERLMVFGWIKDLINERKN